ncbi:MAG: type II toxin-antitoxin system HicB family antitoxin, partial [Acidobacteria bacterium]|nr:type II toxin-antitoxin system HicB family antitoxin [Acidobacteriota bacterium]
MIEISYPARFRRDEDGRQVAHFVDLPEAITDGGDLQEALGEAEDCLGSALAMRLCRREEIPYPSEPRRGHRVIPVPSWIAPKVALYWAMRERRITNSELARRLGCRETVVRRMLDPDHGTRPEKIQAA